MYCGKDISLYDLETTQETDVIDCMDACSMNRPPCYGVSFSTINGTCFLKDSSVTLDNAVAADGFQSALARSSQLSPIDTSCPYLSNSYQTTADGMEFEILCGLDMGGYGDYCPDNDVTCPKHTDTMEECLEYCSISHPLCLGVSWNPDMLAGYPNCYLKNDPSAGTPAPDVGFTTHSALARLPQANISCPTNATYISSNSKSFELTCNEGRSGSSNFTSYHDANLDGCINTCATSAGQDCVGVVYDASMTEGYENCYLLNSTGVPNTVTNSTFALVSSSKSIPSPTSLPRSSGSSSKAWIAGPVIGGLLGIVLLIGFILWRRKRSTRMHQPERSMPSLDYDAAHQDYGSTQQAKTREKTYLLHQLPDRSSNTHEMGPSHDRGHELEG
jgi:hypothetical protein